MDITVHPDTDALIVVDLQRDFCPGGALAVPEGDQIVPVVNRLVRLSTWLTVATRDWHPTDHCSFSAQGGPWPAHCVADSAGAAFHPGFDVSAIRHIVSKAAMPATDAYSGFEGTNLERLLRAHGIRRVFVCGLATDYCVKATVLDARRHQFEAAVITDAILGVEVHPGDCTAALEAMRLSGVALVESTDLNPR